jgi:O-glycosyl hydrolase
MQALFGSPGTQNALGVPAIHLNFLRVPIAAGGAMTVGSPYSYDDNPPTGSDPDLAFFTTAHDLPYIVPTLQQALAVNPGLLILANPWSPPAWMKSNDSLDNSTGQGTLLPADYGPLASYFVKFIRTYASYGIPIDAITPQNEPSSGQFRTGYPGMTLPEGAEAQFIAQNLAPALHAAGLAPKIYGNDLSWDSSAYAGALAADAAAGPELAGIAWHCYFGSPTVMSDLHQTSPGLDQIVSECSPEIRAFGTPEFLISALRNWASVVSLWAVALDPNGGPIQPYNNCYGCRGPVTIDEQSQAVTFRPEYYQLGQVSAFVQPGATRIGSQSYVDYGISPANMETVTSGLDDVAFLNPDGSKVLIVYNNSSTRAPFGVNWHRSYFTYTIPPHAMTTFTWR